MIEFRNVHKVYQTPRGPKVLLQDFSIKIPTGDKVALLGRNGAGKSTMVGMISKTVPPSSGSIRRSGTISWPMGFSGSFAADMTGRQNALFVARIYQVDHRLLLDFVQDFAELGNFFEMPVRSYSSGMRARLAFGLSMGLGFDWYLVDEITSVGDKTFRQKSLEFFRNRLNEAGLIMVSHSPATLREYCNSGIVLDEGHATYHSDLEEAISQHETNMDKVMLAAPAGHEADPETLVNEARRHYKGGDSGRAEKYLLQALSEQPKNSEWVAFLGDIQRRLGNNDAALEQYKRAFEISESLEYQVFAARTLSEIGRADEAEEILYEVITEEPHNVEAAYALARQLYRRGVINEAEALLVRVIGNDPNNAGSHRILAQIYSRRGNHALALHHHAIVAKLLPDNATFLAGFAQAQQRTGDLEGANATYKRVLSLDPDNKDARSYFASWALQPNDRKQK